MRGSRTPPTVVWSSPTVIPRGISPVLLIPRWPGLVCLESWRHRIRAEGRDDGEVMQPVGGLCAAKADDAIECTAAEIQCEP